MIAFLALIAYAVLAGTFGATVLRRMRWTESAPRLGIVAWQALSGSLIASVVLAGLSLAVPVSLVSSDLAGLLDTCVMLLRAQYSTPGGAVVSTAGLLLSLVVIARTAQCLTHSWRTARGCSRSPLLCGLLRTRRCRSDCHHLRCPGRPRC